MTSTTGWGQFRVPVGLGGIERSRPLGHIHISMTQDHYMSRGRVRCASGYRASVAALLDRHDRHAPGRRSDSRRADIRSRHAHLRALVGSHCGVGSRVFPCRLDELVFSGARRCSGDARRRITDGFLHRSADLY